MSQQNEKNPQVLTLLKKQNDLDDNNSNLDRLDLITDIIGSSRRQMGYNPLPPKELNQWVIDWAKVLKPVPTEYLEASFELAMQQHESGPFAAYEIVKAWNAIAQERQHQTTYQKPMIMGNQTIESCPACYGSGWERITETVNQRLKTSVRRCNCYHSKVIDLSDGVPMPEEFSKARQQWIRNHSMR